MTELWEFHTRRLKAGAPVEQLFDRAIFSQNPPLHLAACNSCGTVLRMPRESTAEIVDLYSAEEPPRPALDALFEEQRKFYRPRVAHLQKLLGRSGRVLEVGSYLGAFLTSATEQDWTAIGLDVNETASRYARTRGCDVEIATIESYDNATRFDCVAIWNCFDQLPDPRGALLHARELLVDQGIVALRVPNGAFYTAMRSAPFARQVLAHNNLLGFPYRHGFSSRALRQLLSDVGFAKIHVQGDTLVSTAGPWTKHWARAEETAVKGLLRWLPARLAPWIEIYAQ